MNLPKSKYFIFLGMGFIVYLWVYSCIHIDDCTDYPELLPFNCQIIIRTFQYDNVIRKYVIQGVDFNGKSKILKMNGLIIFNKVSYGDTLIKIKDDSIFTLKSKNKIYRFYHSCNKIEVDSLARN